MEKKLHIVFNAMSLQRGGGLTVLLGLLKGFGLQDDTPFNLTVLCCADATEKAVSQQGIADEVLQFCRNANLIKRQAWMKWSLPKKVKQLEADILLSVNQFIANVEAPQVVYHLNLLRFMPIQKGQGILHYVTEHLRNQASKQALVKASANVFESQFLADSASKVHARKTKHDQVIYIGLPDDLLSIPQSEFSSENRANLFTITSPIPHKDNPTLIKCLAELVKTRPDVDWNLKIAGGYDQWWPPHKELAKELGVFDRIQWLGFIDQATMTSHLQQSLCLVSTSLIESFCMVALESMARGCPPIVSEVTSMPESVGDAAILAEPGSPQSFAQAVIQIHDSEELRCDLVEKGFQWIKNFQWEACGEKFSKLFIEMNESAQSKLADRVVS